MHTKGGVPITIKINAASGQPLYEQIVDQIRLQLLTGQLRDGDQLPSIRALARELQVSIITTKRAYEELEREGLLAVSTGRGTFVRGGGVADSRNQQLDELRLMLNKAADSAKVLGVTQDQFVTLSLQAYQEEKTDE